MPSDSKPVAEPKPRPGSLPLRQDEVAHPVDPIAIAAQSALPPFLTGDAAADLADSHTTAVSKLKAARRKADQLGAVVRDAAFDDWVRRCLVEADRPDAWGQSRVLYESYISHVGRYGATRVARGLSRQVAATETRFGKMMGSLFPKVRRARGWFYPVRLKKGA